MLAHDIRSALSGCLGALDQLDAGSLDTNARRFRDGALVSAQTASRLFEGALDLDAIENNEFALTLEPARLDSFLSETHRRWAAVAAGKSLSLEVDRSANLPMEIRVDRVRFARVLGNVVENAIKHSEGGNIRICVDLDAAGDLRFQVIDCGPGFSEEALDRLFEFKARPRESTKPGTGLGLYIADQLVRQMGGRIGVENTQPSGAIVSICLPARVLVGEICENKDAAAISVVSTGRLPDLSHLNILLAEDNATNQIVVAQMLESMGARFEVASDGVEALKFFESQVFDLALLDIEMPRLSGLDVIRAIRERSDARAQTPIVALTAYAMRSHQEKISAAGADGLIAKPILGIEDLGEALLRYWRRRKGDKAADPVQAGASCDQLIDNEVFGALEKSIGASKMSELLERVAADLAEVRDGISLGLRAKDVTSVRSSSHVLISVAGAIGAITTQQFAERLNRAANSDDWPGVEQNGEVCLTRITELLRLVDGKLNP